MDYQRFLQGMLDTTRQGTQHPCTTPVHPPCLLSLSACMLHFEANDICDLARGTSQGCWVRVKLSNI
jgi:hypothetical protein